jgi:hypothetical protein
VPASRDRSATTIRAALTERMDWQHMPMIGEALGGYAELLAGYRV